MSYCFCELVNAIIICFVQKCVNIPEGNAPLFFEFPPELLNIEEMVAIINIIHIACYFELNDICHG